MPLRKILSVLAVASLTATAPVAAFGQAQYVDKGAASGQASASAAGAAGGVTAGATIAGVAVAAAVAVAVAAAGSDSRNVTGTTATT